MSIDIFNIEPHKVSRSLEGYTIMFYGEPKTGKTSTAAKFPKALLLGFEVGYLAIGGVKPQPINKWSEFKQVLKQLKDPKAHELYSNIIIDTADIAYDLCEKYICNQAGVSAVNELPYGQGWSKTSKEFDECLRSIPQMGYGLVMISHSQDKTFTDENGSEYNQIVPTLGNRPRLIVDRMSDVIGYAHPVEEEDGRTHTVLYMRGTPRFVAGSRFKYTPDSIDFTYDNLVKAIGDAIDKQAEEDAGKFVTDARTTAYDINDGPDFEAMKNEFKELTVKIQHSVSKDEFKKLWAPKIMEITDKYLGVGKKVNDCTAKQAEQLSLILDDLKDLLSNGIDVA